MKKLFIISIISILFLSFSLISLAQIDNFWIMDENLLNDVNNEENEVYLISLDLYWSADTYVPFGYQGRPLPTTGSWVTVNADLKVSGENPKNLKYSWFLDDVFQESKSGYGRDEFKFVIRKAAFTNASHAVLVKVFNESRSFLEERSITIPVISPDLVVYNGKTFANNLPYMTSAKIFDIASDEEVSFLALPYFFNIKRTTDLEFTWTFANKTIKESSLLANVFGLKIINKEVGGSIIETLKIFVSNKRQSDQKIQKTIRVNIY